jgi:phosphatidylserine/phosphatidylglycerophosphate/cardiolipin synthase-like enzyme
MNIGDFNLMNETDSFIKKIYRLLSAGVNVTILIGGRAEKFDPATISLLKDLFERGAKVYHNKRAHAKLILVKSKSEKLVLITSANFTNSGLHQMLEIGVDGLNIDQDTYDQFEKYIIEKLNLLTTTSIDNFFIEWGYV